jgi:succinate-semialdehyde dehydrogenase / glutarate-semialdehyde dehydrogenase
MMLSDPSLLKTEALIAGKWRSSHSGLRFAIENPATETVIAHVPDMGRTETQEAIEAAQTALAAWRKTPAQERAAFLSRWHHAILNHAEDLARILTAEQGKPLAEAMGEVRYAASFVEWFAEEAKRIQGDILESPIPDRRFMVFRQGIGVCAAITPWNFPSAMVTRKLAPALAAGCTVVLKPAEETPLSALALLELAQRAGCPKGVLNVVTSASPLQVGQVLTESPIVRKLSFTGSTEVGRLLMAQCAPTVKKLALELGGNAPFIVFESADLKAAIKGFVTAKYRNAGQTCISPNRVFVHHSQMDAFSEGVVKSLARLNPGRGDDEAHNYGPLINKAAVRKVQEHIADACTKGGRLLAGGQPLPGPGHFFAPTVVAGVRQDMRIASEETFGPVAALSAFETEEEVLALANQGESGLAAYVYTQNMGQTFRVIDQLDVGVLGINTTTLGAEQMPFGGVKQSGIGKEGSRHGLDAFLEMKSVTLAGL